MKTRTFIVTILALFITAGIVFGGGNQQSAGTDGGTTIKVLFKGPKTEGFDAVYEEYLRRTKDTLNIKLDITFVEHADYRDKLNLEITSGSEYDLVYEAPWLLLRTLAPDGYYADLRSYFNNDQYPGLKKAFSMQVMESNLWLGQMCYIPLYRAYGSGIPSIHYRQDWADAWGIGQIDSYAKLERYWQAAKDRGILPLSVTASRGFYQLEPIPHPGMSAAEASKAGVMSVSAGSTAFMVYVRDNKVVATAPLGAGDAAFKDFPPPWNRDTSTERLEKFAEWNKKGYISQDSIMQNDANTPFWAGLSASVIGTLDDVENNSRNIGQYSPDARIGEFIYNDDIRNLVPGTLSVSLSANNGLCVPNNSKKKDAVMRFLDWMFASKENHDLFELGIKDKDYRINTDGTFKPLTTYPANWPGYGFTWNPNYVTYSEDFTAGLRVYRDYERAESSITLPPLTGFNFDGTAVDIASLVAQVKAISDKVAVTKLHGILSDGSRSYGSAKEMMNANIAECYRAGLQKIQDELAKQIQAHLDGQKK